MSVLFQALNRAARDYHQQQATVVPLLAIDNQSTGVGTGRAVALFMVAALALSGVGSAYYLLSNGAADKTISLIKPSAVAAESTQQQRAGDNSGIVLSDGGAESEIADIAQKMQDLPIAYSLEKDAGKLPRVVVSENSDKSANAIAQAQSMLDDGDYVSALSIYDRVLKSDRENYAALAGKAYALQQDKQYRKAAAIGLQILKRDPEDIAVRTNVVAALAGWGSPAAVQELKQMVVERPNFAPARASLAKCLLSHDNVGEAAIQLKKALEIDPKNNFYRLSLAIIYDRMENKDIALALYRQVFDARFAVTASLPLTWESVEQRIKYLAGQ
ncbi:MAG: tetratricopeptide repeat protein [Alphaproteobacteria bacterium]|nr:tetratricopeptide repeat protein [Alphaproteobacteria bacterium]